MSVFAEYLAAISKEHAAGDATEHTHRPVLKTLLESVAKGITATNEPKRILCGSPDFQVSRKGVPIGHVETKDIGTNFDEMETGKGPSGEQFTRYRDGLPNWILSDYLQFRWFVGGEKRLTARIADVDAKGKVKPLPGGEEQLGQLLAAFFEQPALTIATAKELARRMAGMTRIIRDLITGSFKHEKERGWLHNWLSAFREILIPDLDEKQFADMFAQTLAYGLFAARVHAPPGKPFSRELAAFNLPKTNPFLRKLFAEIAGVNMPDSIAWAVDDIVELLKHADMAEILADFGKSKGEEDPVVHFYETFLAAYDAKMRELRGVYYTPAPVASYIVRSIDHLLKTRFNRPKGLADENTLILDPATGTATFLYFVIEQIHRKFTKQAGAWDGYVAKHLLNRLFGFELLMAPYAVAHLKLGMQLQETGYQFDSEQRLGIYLTNTLEEAAKQAEHIFAGWFAEEANAAAEIKRDRPIMVVLGNPPYSGISANRSKDADGKLTFIGKLIEDYKTVDGQPLAERKHWLQDDYVKFIRFAEWRIDQTGEGVVGLITNHGYLDNPTFRGMRRHLMGTFGEIFVLNLHGNSKKKEKAPDGSKDENVFDIQQGVAIILCLKKQSGAKSTEVKYADLWGPRSSKYEVLGSTDARGTRWAKLKPSSPFYLFIPHDGALQTEYDRGWQVMDIFPLHGVGAVMARDSLTVAFAEEDLWQKLREFISLPVEEARLRFGLGKDARDWKVETAQADLRTASLAKSKIAQMLYRPFDRRLTYYTGKSKGFYASACSNVLSHLLSPNLGLITSRSVEIGSFEHVFCTRSIICHHSASLKEVNYLFPLYVYPNGDPPPNLFMHENGRAANLAAKFVDAITAKFGLRFVPDGRGNLRKTIGPEDIFHYVYAVFHSPTYRTRYADFLKIDFPRLPLTSDLGLFRALAAKGAELVALHLLESARLEDFLTDWPVKGDNVVEKVRYAEKDGRVWINNTQYFGGAPRAAWEFCVGGYQVCERWLKDRKGRKLSYEDTQHYQKIVVALSETIRLMGKIDEVISQHGGWPIQ
ncbi:MAG: type ISP restriction/modification enzyme [Thermoguttaceae bacterium]|jgi:predicted helicase